MSSLGSQASPAASASQHEETVDIPIEILIDHLLNAKKALSSVGTLWHANKIVSTAQSALEESVIITARMGFVQRGITQQVKLLDRARSGIQTVYEDGQVDFQAVIQSLDVADDRLKQTMQTLRETIVTAAFRPTDSEPRTLLDFIDESSVDTLRNTLKQTIDASQASRKTFHASLKALDDDRRALLAAISSAPSPTRGKDSPVPPLLNELETHAAEMAVLLDSLTSHFDLCANAVRHTEGGSLALKDAVTNNRLPDGISVSGVIPSPSSSSHLDPMSDKDRRDMLAVIADDANEVPAVVQDLEIHLQEMESILPHILNHVQEQRASYRATATAFSILEGIASRLPNYIAASTSFVVEWETHKNKLQNQALELDNMRQFYEGYLAGYDGLILEVARRREREEKMKSVLRKALEHVEKLHDADTREREAFRRDVGDFLPSDLWPGLVANAPRWEVGIFENEGEEGAQESTPDLERGVLEEAMRREKERASSG